jgi:hypothetical protein
LNVFTTFLSNGCPEVKQTKLQDEYPLRYIAEVKKTLKYYSSYFIMLWCLAEGQVLGSNAESTVNTYAEKWFKISRKDEALYRGGIMNVFGFDPPELKLCVGSLDLRAVC